MMLSRLDHIVLLARDYGAALADYELLFGTAPGWQSADDHFQSALFQTGNMALEIMAPVPDSPATARVNDILGARPAALTSLAFATDDIKTAHHLCTRRGLTPSDISDGQSAALGTGETRRWQRFRLADDTCAGLKTFVLEHASEPLKSNMGHDLQLDHLVINTPNPDRAIAQYGARLDIPLKLDRTMEQFGARFMFFKLGGLVLEIIHRLGTAHDPSADDEIWGLTWRVEDLDAVHKRLSGAGVTLSDIRTGRKPGTRVFTVKSHSAGVPMLFLGTTP